MERCKLVVPNTSMMDEIRAYRQEMIDAGSSMDGCGSLCRCESPAEWLAYNAMLSKRETTPAHLVPQTQFVCVREGDGRIVGMIQVRHTLNAYLRQFGGHIGYSVRPSERRKGYAARMLAALLPYCKALGLERVLVTCNAGNEASRRTILKNGGVYDSTVREPAENEAVQRYWIKL